EPLGAVIGCEIRQVLDEDIEEEDSRDGDPEGRGALDRDRGREPTPTAERSGQRWGGSEDGRRGGVHASGLVGRLRRRRLARARPVAAEFRLFRRTDARGAPPTPRGQRGPATTGLC